MFQFFLRKNWNYLIYLTLGLTALFFILQLNGCTPCYSFVNFCASTAEAPFLTEWEAIDGCIKEVLICPGESAILYWNFSNDIQSVTITSSFGENLGTFTRNPGSITVNPLSSTTYLIKGNKGKCEPKETVNVTVITESFTWELYAKTSDYSLWSVDVSPVAVSSSIMVQKIRSFNCSFVDIHNFWPNWNCSKISPESFSVPISNSDTNLNCPHLVGEWKFTLNGPGAIYQYDTACFLLTITCGPCLIQQPIVTPTPTPQPTSPPPTHT